MYHFCCNPTATSRNQPARSCFIVFQASSGWRCKFNRFHYLRTSPFFFSTCARGRVGGGCERPGGRRCVGLHGLCPCIRVGLVAASRSTTYGVLAARIPDGGGRPRSRGLDYVDGARRCGGQEAAAARTRVADGSNKFSLPCPYRREAELGRRITTRTNTGE